MEAGHRNGPTSLLPDFESWDLSAYLRMHANKEQKGYQLTGLQENLDRGRADVSTGAQHHYYSSSHFAFVFAVDKAWRLQSTSLPASCSWHVILPAHRRRAPWRIPPITRIRDMLAQLMTLEPTLVQKRKLSFSLMVCYASIQEKLLLVFLAQSNCHQ